MGYYTEYTLIVHEQPEDVMEKIEESLKKMGVCGDALLEHEGDTFYPCSSTKWYDYENDMMEISNEFQDVLFELHAEGEEPGDLWCEYFKNGKGQFCLAIISYPPFDENELE